LNVKSGNGAATVAKGNNANNTNTGFIDPLPVIRISIYVNLCEN
jgi:hypothetical protein